MALRPLIVKLHFYLPTAKDKISTLAHLEYMGNPSKEELIRAGESPDRDDNAVIHAAYIAGRPGSTGYFGPNEHNLPNPDAIAEGLRRHQCPVWRAIVSVTEADARAMGGQLLFRPAWEDAAREALPRMADKLGIKRDNLQWVAAMHRKEGHPHLHLLFWETTAERTRGVLADGERRDVRRLWVQSLYRPERDRLGLEKQLQRELLIESSRADLRNVQVKGIRWRIKEPAPIPYPPRLGTSQAQELACKLNNLQAMMPGTGRAALAYMPPEIKMEARQIVNWMITRSPEYKQAFDRYVEIAREFAMHYSDNMDYLKQAEDKARADITDRIAQGVIRQAASLDRAVKREEVVSIAFAAIRGAEGAPETLRDQLYREITAIVGLRGDERRQRADVLARRLLADPALRPTMEEYRRAGGKEEKLVASVANSIGHAADYINYQRANAAHQAAVSWWIGMMQALRQQEQELQRVVEREQENEFDNEQEQEVSR